VRKAGRYYDSRYQGNFAATAAVLGALSVQLTSAGSLTASLRTGGEGQIVPCEGTADGIVTARYRRQQHVDFRFDGVSDGLVQFHACPANGAATSTKGGGLQLRVRTMGVDGKDAVHTVGACAGCSWCSIPVNGSVEYTITVALSGRRRRRANLPTYTAKLRQHAPRSATILGRAEPVPFTLRIRCPSATDKAASREGLKQRDAIDKSMPGHARGGAVPGWCNRTGVRLMVTLSKRRWDVSGFHGGGTEDSPAGLTPRRLYMTYHNLSRIPKKVFAAVERYAPAYRLVLFSDVHCIRYLRKWYGRDVVRRFLCTENGAHRADLFRYALLYHRGGVYLDVKTVLTRELREVFPDRRRAYTALSTVGSTIYQGVIATPPRNPAIWRMLQSLLAADPADFDLMYFKATQQAYSILSTEFAVAMHPGPNAAGRGPVQWTLFKEECAEAEGPGRCIGAACVRHVRGKLCTNPDRYGYCCSIFDGDTEVFKTRFTDYPW